MKRKNRLNSNNKIPACNLVHFFLLFKQLVTLTERGASSLYGFMVDDYNPREYKNMCTETLNFLIITWFHISLGRGDR